MFAITPDPGRVLTRQNQKDDHFSVQTQLQTKSIVSEGPRVAAALGSMIATKKTQQP